MRIAFAVVLVALAACQKTEPAMPPPVADAAPAAALAAASPSSEAAQVLGWTTTGGSFLLLGSQAPAFSGKLQGGDDISLAKLRNRWTIVGFTRGSGDGKEETFAQALTSAVGQDPDLDFLSIVSDAEAPKRPTVLDGDGKIAGAFGVTDFPTYLLIGPDLTIEGVRSASASPDDGIKDVIRGVAEVRKQIAAPE